jgi:predicted acylesterase/phospholipase RssA
MTKRGLVISGGGSKGAFAVGALEYLLLDRGLTFDVVAGTSTGSLIAPFVLTNDLPLLIDLYTSVRQTDILLGRPVAQTIALSALFGSVSSIYDSTPLWYLLNRNLTPDRMNTLLNSGKQLFITAVSLQTAQVVYFYCGPDSAVRSPADSPYVLARVTSKEQLASAILASADEPVFAPPVDIVGRGTPTGPYVDGGVRNVFPARVVIDSGVDELYGIILSPEDDTIPGPYNNVLTILKRTMDLFCDEVASKDVWSTRLYNAAVRHREMFCRRLANPPYGLTPQQIEDLLVDAGTPDPFREKRIVTFHLIRPLKALEETYRTTGLRFDPATMARMMLDGRTRAREVIEGGV